MIKIDLLDIIAYLNKTTKGKTGRHRTASACNEILVTLTRSRATTSFSTNVSRTTFGWRILRPSLDRMCPQKPQRSSAERERTKNRTKNRKTVIETRPIIYRKWGTASVLARAPFITPCFWGKPTSPPQSFCLQAKCPRECAKENGTRTRPTRDTESNCKKDLFKH